MRDVLLDEKPSQKMNDPVLSGVEKASIIFRFLSSDDIKPILRFLDRSDVEQISKHMLKMDSIDKDSLMLTLADFRLAASGIVSPDGPEEKAQYFLDQYDEIQMEYSPEGRLKRKLVNLFTLEKTPPETIVELLQNDHEQVWAIVLSRFSPVIAKNVLALLPPEKRDDILNRIAHLKNIDTEVLNNLNEILKNKLSEFESSGDHSGPKIVADILSLLPEEDSTKLMSSIQQKNEKLHQKIQKYYLTFSDLVALESSALQKVLSTIDPQVIAVAICKLPRELIEKCFSVITRRSVTLIEEEFKSLEKVLPDVVLSAQQKIIKNARKLESDRKIDLGKK